MRNNRGEEKPGISASSRVGSYELWHQKYKSNLKIQVVIPLFGNPSWPFLESNIADQWVGTAFSTHRRKKLINRKNQRKKWKLKGAKMASNPRMVSPYFSPCPPRTGCAHSWRSHPHVASHWSEWSCVGWACRSHEGVAGMRGSPLRYPSLVLGFALLRT